MNDTVDLAIEQLRAAIRELEASKNGRYAGPRLVRYSAMGRAERAIKLMSHYCDRGYDGEHEYCPECSSPPSGAPAVTAVPGGITAGMTPDSCLTGRAPPPCDPGCTGQPQTRILHIITGRVLYVEKGLNSTLSVIGHEAQGRYHA